VTLMRERGESADVLVAGVDGCRVGWLCVLLDAATGLPQDAFIRQTLAEIAALEDAVRIAIDVPMGIDAVSGTIGRGCDTALRRELGQRQSSVFAVPARAALAESDYRLACDAALAHSHPPRMVSKQCFHIFPKIREADALITPELQTRIVECHPEGAFWAMNGKRPLAEPKKLKSRGYPPGLALRRALLITAGFPPKFLAGRRFKAQHAGEDDFLDACACAWTARRVLRGEAHRFPDEPRVDPRGLRMQIWA
jgi:predicted RNase H-like nuclease